MATLGTAFVNIRANLAPLRSALARAHNVVKSTMSRVSSIMHKTAYYIRRAMLLTTAAITGVIYAAAKFEKQLASVATMLDKKTLPILTKYRNELIRLSKEAGQSTETLSKGLYNILSASIAPTKAIGVLNVATKMAIAGQTDVAAATKALVAVLKSYGMEVGDAGAVSDKLFATLKRGLFTFEQFAGSIGKSAATAALAGVSLEELLAVIATTTRAGVSIEETMTAINSSIMAFLKPTDEAVKIAKEFGIELSSAFLKEKGLVAAIKALDKASAEQVMQLVTNRRAFKAMAASLKDISGLTSDLRFITERATGETAKAYTKMSITASFEIRRVKESIKAMAVALGTPMLEPLTRLIEAFKLVFGKIEKWAIDNQGKIKFWSEKVVEKIQDAIWWVENLYDVMKHPKGGIGAALKIIYEEIKKGLVATIDYLKPKAIKLGDKIGDAVIKKIDDWLAGTWYGKVKKGVTKGAEAVATHEVEFWERQRELRTKTFREEMGRETIARRMPEGETWWAGQKRGYSEFPELVKKKILDPLSYLPRKLYEHETEKFRTGIRTWINSEITNSMKAMRETQRPTIITEEMQRPTIMTRETQRPTIVTENERTLRSIDESLKKIVKNTGEEPWQ